MNQRPVAIVTNASDYVGPALTRKLARAGFDLVLGDPDDDLVDEVEELGVGCWIADNVKNLAEPTAAPRLVDLAMDAYDRIDSVVFFGGEVVTGSFMKSSDEDLERVLKGNIEAVYRPLRVFLPPLVEQGSGQVLAITSASALRVTPGAPLYSATRAAANMLVRNVAAEVAKSGVQVNAVGTNFMDFPGFLAASGANDPEVRRHVEAMTPMGRLGSMEEFAHFCMAFLDGTARFHTGQTVGFDGGWSA
ncbi:MAG: SDR family oxidoreductase [Acidimicrobiales bacterium]|nr:SDR family oxidoreductase [Acidimicrobiales bacterium]